MSKFSIVLCTALFASAVSASFVRPNLTDLQDDALKEIDSVIWRVKLHMRDLDFGSFLNATVAFGREAWSRNSDITIATFEQVISIIAEKANIEECVKLHADLVEDTKTVISKTQECMVNKINSSQYFDYFPVVYDKAYIPKLERMRDHVKACNATSRRESIESIAEAIICIQRVTAEATIFTDRMILELRIINNESEARSKKIEECAYEGLSSLEDKSSKFIRSFEECKNRTISSG